MSMKHKWQLTIPDSVLEAVLYQDNVDELPHMFYRYPVCFAPAFAGEVVQSFPKEGEVMLDPSCGGGFNFKVTERALKWSCGRISRNGDGFAARYDYLFPHGTTDSCRRGGHNVARWKYHCWGGFRPGCNRPRKNCSKRSDNFWTQGSWSRDTGGVLRIYSHGGKVGLKLAEVCLRDVSKFSMSTKIAADSQRTARYRGLTTWLCHF